MERIIDCHIYIQTIKLINKYFEKRKWYAVAIKAIDSLIDNGNEFYEATKKFDNIFICDCRNFSLQSDFGGE